MVDAAQQPTEATANPDANQDVGEAAYLSERQKRGTPNHRRLRIALAHDWLVGMRGGEWVLDRIASLVKKQHIPANLSVLFYKKGKYTTTLDEFEIRKSRFNALPGVSGPLRRWMLPLYPSAVEALSERLAKDHAQQPIELLISTSSGLIKGMAAPEGVPHICYCHAPARYLWSMQDDYTAGGGPTAMLRKLGFGMFTNRLRKWDRESVANVSTMLANSRHTAREIERCWGRGSIVVYPPVRTKFFTVDPNEKREDFWLVVSALEPYKRTELAIEAALLAGKRLFIAGTGSQSGRLRAFAKKTAKRITKAGKPGRDNLVEFMGRVGDEHLRQLYRRASVLLFPQVEDFGIVAVEAQACGCPVVARRAGGALDTVLEGRTGAFFDKPTPNAIIDAVKRVPSKVHAQCRENAERFAEPVFDKAMQKVIASAVR
ncbi:MAG: glycosyltransferase [Planctomycetota bacterium]